MLKFYVFNTFNAVKVLLTAVELGAEFDLVMLNPTQDLQTPEHLARHPWGKMPVLEHDGEILVESAAICRYLARLHDNRLYSADPLTAARIDQTMDMIGYHPGRWIGSYFWQEVVRRKFFNKEPDPQALAEADGFLDKQLPYLDQLLGRQPYLCGEELTIADTFGFAYFQIKEYTRFSFQPYPGIERWYQAVNTRPSVEKVASLINKS